MCVFVLICLFAPRYFRSCFSLAGMTQSLFISEKLRRESKAHTMAAQVARLWISTYLPEQRGGTAGSKTGPARGALANVH